MNTQLAKRITECILIALIIVSIVWLAISFTNREYSYQMYNTSSVSYVRGVVKEIVSESLTPSGSDGEYNIGKQVVKVEFAEGNNAGQTVEINNYLSATHNVVLKEGSKVIICADEPENVAPYYTIYSYDRGLPVLIVVLCFFGLIVLVGKKRGLMSCIGLSFTVCMVLCYLLPALYEGENAVMVSVITVFVSATVSCFCISGLGRKTLLNIIGTVFGCISAALVYWLFMAALHITGNAMDSVDTLVVIAQATGLKFSGLLFSAVLISSLGAVMDVAVSIGASLSEIKELNPEISANQMFRSGMNIGKDMIGTMSNTLILAFAGGALTTLIILISKGVQTNQLLSSDYVALELAQGLASSAAVILTVPISAGVYALGYKKHKKTEEEHQ